MYRYVIGTQRQDVEISYLQPALCKIDLNQCSLVSTDASLLKFMQDGPNDLFSPDILQSIEIFVGTSVKEVIWAQVLRICQLTHQHTLASYPQPKEYFFDPHSSLYDAIVRQQAISALNEALISDPSNPNIVNVGMGCVFERDEVENLIEFLEDQRFRLIAFDTRIEGDQRVLNICWSYHTSKYIWEISIGEAESVNCIQPRMWKHPLVSNSMITWSVTHFSLNNYQEMFRLLSRSSISRDAGWILKSVAFQSICQNG